MVTLDAVLVRTDRCLCSEIGSDLVMLDVESGSYFSLDLIGRDIWNRLEHPVRVSDLCAGLVQAYNAPPDVIHTDVLRLLDEMLDEGLVSASA